MGTNVYIDGFNLYNGAVRATTFKWLDLGAMCQTLLPNHNIHRIRYFTAGVSGFPHDPDAPSRQNLYLRALRTIPHLSVHKDGWFSSHPIWLPEYPIVLDANHRPRFVRVQRMEEKRTDVDLATHLLLDCFSNDFDEAVVISNDSDLFLPIERVRTQFGKRIGAINPHAKWKMSGHLMKAASYHFRTINKSVLRKCQFPPTLSDADGTITKPASW
jgi:uncharacterized LabA/DUF88 family protein